MVKVSCAPALKVPAVIVTVNTPAALMAAVPAGVAVAPAVKVRVPGAATASPAPLIVMMILPVAGIVTAGVRDTVMMTLEAPGTLLLRVIAGMAAPSVLVTMATKVPDVEVSMRAPTEVVVAAAMVVDAI